MTKIGVVIPTGAQALFFDEAQRQRLQLLGDVQWHTTEETLNIDAAVDLLRGCDIGVGSWKTVYPCAELLAGCPDLRLWEHVAGSVRKMFGPHLDGRELTIASCAPAIAESVAEHAVGSIIVGLRGILDNGAENRGTKLRNSWQRKQMYEATVGIVGASQVGRNAIRFLEAFGCAIHVYDPFLSEADAAKLGVTKEEDLTRLCAECDAVSLHTPALPTTEKIIGAEQLQAMRDDAVFVNTSRGMCVDEAALITELEQSRLLAFLDVSRPEPAAADSPLRSLPNVVYTSHISGGGPSRRMGRQAVDDIEAFINGGAPKMMVTEEMLERLA